MDAIEALKTRRSVRKYKSREVPRELLRDMVDCARLAPTAMNGQPWDFVVVTDVKTRRQIAKQVPHAPFITEAPVCIAVLCYPGMCWVQDGSAATLTLLLAAWAHGLGTCWISGESQPYADPIRDLLGGSPQQKLLSLVTVGYPGEKPTVEKRPLDGVLHWERMP